MEMPTDKKEGMPEIETRRLSDMESSIVSTMRRFFTVSPGSSKDALEIAIMKASKRYFEGYPNG